MPVIKSNSVTKEMESSYSTFNASALRLHCTNLLQILIKTKYMERRTYNKKEVIRDSSENLVN